MPYSVGGKLPPHVAKLSDKKQRQWVHVWNSEFDKHGDEGRAFAAANSVAAKEMLGEWYDLSTWLESDFASPVGLSRFWKGAAEKEVETEPVADAATSQLGDKDGGTNIVKAVLDGVKALFAVPIDVPDVARPLTFVQTKEGRLRWIAVPSNNFQDREAETFTEAAHHEYVDWATKSGVYPELWLWHGGPGTKWGQCDWLDVCDGFLVASGLVDAGKEQTARNLAREDVGVSHGFYSAKAAGIIHKYRTFELSPLPTWAAANEWTAFAAGNGSEAGVGMSFTPQKKNWLIQVGGLPAASVDAMEQGLSDLATNLKARGIGYKDMSAMFETMHAEQDDLDNVWGQKAVTGANKTKPSEYADVPTEKFLDPENFKYPADEKHLHAALSYFNHDGQQAAGGYSDAKWAAMGGKLAGLMGEGYSYKGGKVVKSTKAMDATKKKADADADAAEDAADNSDDEAAEGETTKKTKKEIADLQSAVASLTTKFDQFMSKAMPVMEKALLTEDERTANHFKAAVAAMPGAGAFRASEAAGNVTGTQVNKEAADWFGRIAGDLPVAASNGNKAVGA